MQETRRGLPNTCTACGNDPGFTWWSEHDDAALSGQGYCWDCANETAQTVSFATTAVAVVIPDNLTQIKGIGAKRAAMLNELDVMTFAELAEADADALAQALEVSVETVADWVETARMLSA